MTKIMKISDKVHEDLIKIKSVGDFKSLSDVVEHLIEGATDEYNVISRPQVAIVLESYGYGNFNPDGGCECFESNEVKITYKNLKESEVGEKFYCYASNFTYFYDEVAEVIAKTDDLVIVKVTGIEEMPTGETITHQVYGVSLL